MSRRGLGSASAAVRPYFRDQAASAKASRGYTSRLNLRFSKPAPLMGLFSCHFVFDGRTRKYFRTNSPFRFLESHRFSSIWYTRPSVRFLVALPAVPALFICAKHLFFAAILPAA
jgi:hypothetical protein